MSKGLEALKRIDERNYLTEREHKEFLKTIEQDLDKLEELKKAQDIEISNLKFTDNENKYQTSIRVLKEAFIVLGRGDIADTCWFKYLEELEKENKRLANALKKKKGKLRHYATIKKENQELKNAIELLKDMFNTILWVDDMDCYIRIGECDYLISWEQYKILSEVFG